MFTHHNENFHNIKNLVQHIMDFSHHIMHSIQHIIKCEQDIMTMMHQMFLFLTIRQLWRSIRFCKNLKFSFEKWTVGSVYCPLVCCPNFNNSLSLQDGNETQNESSLLGGHAANTGKVLLHTYDTSRRISKPTICICENKDADQLCSNFDQRLCFRYTDSTIPQLLII